MRTDILGVGFDDLTLEEAVARGTAFLEEDRFHYVVTPNPELVDRPAGRGLPGGPQRSRSGASGRYRRDICRQDPGPPPEGALPGIDFASGLMASMAAGGKRLYLLGAKPGVAEAAARNLEARYPGLSICGTHDGYFQEDGPVVEEIRRSGADAVFVCLGAPKQEYWMREHGPATGARSWPAWAGVWMYSPAWWSGPLRAGQKMGLEWLYRLMKEPSRIGRMARLPLFLASALGERCKRKGG